MSLLYIKYELNAQFEAIPVFDCAFINYFILKTQELYQLIEGQNTTLCKLREMAHRNQLAQCKVRQKAGVMMQTQIQDGQKSHLLG